MLQRARDKAEFFSLLHCYHGYWKFWFETEILQ